MLHVRLLLHIYIYIYVCMYVYIYMYVCVYVCLSVCLSACLPAWLAGWLSVCMYVYVICMYSISYVFSYTLLQTNICVESHCESRYKLVNGFPISHALSSFVARPPKKQIVPIFFTGFSQKIPWTKNNHQILQKATTWGWQQLDPPTHYPTSRFVPPNSSRPGRLRSRQG